MSNAVFSTNTDVIGLYNFCRSHDIVQISNTRAVQETLSQILKNTTLSASAENCIEKTKISESSGNVFADLGLENADDLYNRSNISIKIIKIINQKKYKQRELAELFNIKQPEVSHLMNGRFNRFSESKLLGFLEKISPDTKVFITNSDKI